MSLNSLFYWNKYYYIYYFLLSTSFLLGVLFLYASFDDSDFSFRFYTIVSLFNANIIIGLDMISFFFIFLTSIILPLCILFNFSTNISLNDKKIFFSLFIVIELLLIQVFLVLDLVWFYILFEFLLIPFYVIIVLNNVNVKIQNKKEVNRKLNAFLLLFFYTIISSFFMLISIFFIYLSTGTTSIPLLTLSFFPDHLEKALWLCIFISFSIKVPILPFHIWLPEAHVESPTEASVILAAIILKIGAYGMVRILIPIFTCSTVYFCNLVWFLSLCTILYSGMNAMIQIDIKRIIAYASIGHMNVGVLGLFSFDLDSLCGSYVLMIGHGFVSGGLFFCIGMIYNRLHNKNLNYMNGLIHLVPTLCVIFFILILSNNALPGTVNFIGEVIILNVGFKKNMFFFFLSFGFGIFVTSIYGFLLCNKILYGMPLRTIFSRYIKDLTLLEVSIFIPILLWIVFLGIFPNFILDLLEKDLLCFNNIKYLSLYMFIPFSKKRCIYSYNKTSFSTKKDMLLKTLKDIKKIDFLKMLKKDALEELWIIYDKRDSDNVLILRNLPFKDDLKGFVWVLKELSLWKESQTTQSNIDSFYYNTHSLVSYAFDSKSFSTDGIMYKSNTTLLSKDKKTTIPLKSTIEWFTLSNSKESFQEAKKLYSNYDYSKYDTLLISSDICNLLNIGDLFLALNVNSESYLKSFHFTSYYYRLFSYYLDLHKYNILKCILMLFMFYIRSYYMPEPLVHCMGKNSNDTFKFLIKLLLDSNYPNRSSLLKKTYEELLINNKDIRSYKLPSHVDSSVTINIIGQHHFDRAELNALSVFLKDRNELLVIGSVDNEHYKSSHDLLLFDSNKNTNFVSKIIELKTSHSRPSYLQKANFYIKHENSDIWHVFYINENKMDEFDSYISKHENYNYIEKINNKSFLANRFSSFLNECSSYKLYINSKIINNYDFSYYSIIEKQIEESSLTTKQKTNLIYELRFINKVHCLNNIEDKNKQTLFITEHFPKLTFKKHIIDLEDNFLLNDTKKYNINLISILNSLSDKHNDYLELCYKEGSETHFRKRIFNERNVKDTFESILKKKKIITFLKYNITSNVIHK